MKALQILSKYDPLCHLRAMYLHSIGEIRNCKISLTLIFWMDGHVTAVRSRCNEIISFCIYN